MESPRFFFSHLPLDVKLIGHSLCITSLVIFSSIDVEQWGI